MSHEILVFITSLGVQAAKNLAQVCSAVLPEFSLLAYAISTRTISWNGSHNVNQTFSIQLVDKDLKIYSCITDKNIWDFILGQKFLSHQCYRTKVSKGAKIRNRYNQVPHLTQDTNGKVTNSQLYTTNKSQEVSPFPAGDHKAQINRRAQKLTNTRLSW